MEWDFDKKVERKGTNSIKWDYCDKFLGGEGLLPLWVADMDFQPPWQIKESIVKRAGHEIYGYTPTPDSCSEALKRWAKKRYDLHIEKEWINYTPGIVTGLSLIVQTFTEPGDKVIIQPPVYPPFFGVVEKNKRQVVNNPLRLEDGQYRFDFEQLKEIIDENTKMLILCNPHNPVGRVWNKEELEALYKITNKHDILVVADEIHADIVYSDYKFTPFTKVAESKEAKIITCMAPSKTFNIAGLQTSAVIIPNDSLRRKFKTTLECLAIHGLNALGTVAFEAAYTHGEPWLEELIEYLESNIKFVKDYCASKIPTLKIGQIEGTYLVWIDFSKLSKDPKVIRKIVLDDAKVGLNEGHTFGTGGECFMRMNVGCSRTILEAALQRIEKAILDYLAE